MDPGVIDDVENMTQLPLTGMLNAGLDPWTDSAQSPLPGDPDTFIADVLELFDAEQEPVAQNPGEIGEDDGAILIPTDDD